MKISFNWLKEFVDIHENPQQLATRLTNVGLAVDAVETGTEAGAIFELDIATNRPDCLSHIGVARETGVIYSSPLRLPQLEVTEEAARADSIFSISISDPDLCPRYCGRYIEGVKIGPSPDWLRIRLESLGIRSINNVTDVTNYVMLELGQPLHAFDADTLHGHKIIVRRAHSHEKITTLDGVEHVLEPSTLVIADQDRAVAVAGVMGGQETEISTNTRNVFLESANFDALSIRKTSRNLRLSTEASYRFERGADIEMAHFACDRAAAMIRKIAGGKIYKGLIDVYPGKAKPVIATLRRSRIKAFLGTSVEDRAVDDIFHALGFNSKMTNEGWSIEVPSHRIDISREEDLLEEIARHYGYERFPATLPAWSGYGSALPLEAEERLLRNQLAAAGYSEIISMAFSDQATEQKFRPDVEPIRLLNPMAEDESILRTSLVPSMFRSVQWNLNRGTRDLQLYELAKVYRKGSENRWLILTATGTLRPKSVHETQRDFNFFDIKGDVEAIFRTFDLDLKIERKNLPAYYHPGRSVRCGGIGFLGELHPEYAEMFKLRQRVYIAELDVETILRARKRRSIRPVFRFPSIRRDLSLLVDKRISYEDVRTTITRAGIPELIQMDPFDRLDSGPFPESKYSLSISLTYQSPERTLTDEEVEQFDQRILLMLEQQLSAQLRK